MVFDSPNHPGVFEERAKFCEDLINAAKKKDPNCAMVWAHQTKITSQDQLEKIYIDIIDNGGEGVMLRAPGSPYVAKRTNLLLKLKESIDAEAVIIAYEEGIKKNVGKVGALRCDFVVKGKKSGVIFNIGTGFTDAQREGIWNDKSKHYLPIGTLVSFTYMELSRDGVPRLPRYRGIRQDLAVPLIPPVVEPTAAPNSNVCATFRNNINTYLEIHFDELKVQANLQKPNGWAFKIRGYNKAIEIFKKASEPILDMEIALREFRNNGEAMKGEETHFQKKGTFKSSTLNRIDEILKTGTLEGVNIQAGKSPFSLLMEISGIGNTKAKQLVDMGITSIDDLKKAVADDPSLLTNQMTIGLKYHKDLLKRIPRTEMDLWNTLFQKYTKSLKIKGAKVILVGSYRRKAKDSGDVDVLFTADTFEDANTLFDGVIKKISDDKILHSMLTDGKTQKFGVGRLTPKNIHRRIDLFVYKPEVFPYAILHSTGSDKHNKKMRVEALKQGLSLSQYGLKKKNSDNLMVIDKIKTENDIFTYLKMEYVEPEMRL